MTRTHDTSEGLPAAATQPVRQRPRVRVVTSAELFGGVAELLIEHEGALYRLRRTSKGKLLLTK